MKHDQYVKPCPFCGAIPEVDISLDEDKEQPYYVHCSNPDCPAQECSCWSETLEGAVDKWNTRYTSLDKKDLKDFKYKMEILYFYLLRLSSNAENAKSQIDDTLPLVKRITDALIEQYSTTPKPKEEET